MHFKISKNMRNYFSNIINLGGSHASEDKSKFIQFDVYYCCALIGMAACKLDEDDSDLNDMVDRYPNPYRNCRAQIAGLLIATEAKRLGIDIQSSQLEKTMLQYLNSEDGTLLSEEGVRILNAYSLKGAHLLQEYPLIDKPASREEFLDGFNLAMQKYSTK